MISNLRKVASKLAGWQGVEEVAKKLSISRGTAYVYLSKLDKASFIHEKIKRPRGTFYRISPIPKPLKEKGMLAKTELASDLEEFSNKEISSEQKIAYLINQYRENNNSRFLTEAKKLIRKIRNWKELYRYVKAYRIKEDFTKFYMDCRKKVAKCPRMPQRYRRLLNAS